ncbi:hypothetical protein BLGI_1257 [Brevibacillus laterosporus GI-9]|nr:hypothetical protein BLGI_1257 [Brevibacillus laterosporus GI-9]
MEKRGMFLVRSFTFEGKAYGNRGFHLYTVAPCFSSISRYCRTVLPFNYC